MAADVHSAALFYGTACGGVACRLLRERLLQLWPDLSRQSVLGLGFAPPYLRAWRGQASRCVSAGPGAARWPLVAANLACAVDEAALPFPDLSFDRILLVHGLEVAENARALLREAWRVLRGRWEVDRRRAEPRRGCGRMSKAPRSGMGSPFLPGRSTSSWPRTCSGSSGATTRCSCRQPGCGW